METNLEQLECYIYQGKIALASQLEKKIEERLFLWSKSSMPVEWACVLIGAIRLDGEEEVPIVEDFFELPAFNLNREHGLVINLNDIARIAEKFYVIGLYHSHPSGDLMPSPSDIATFLYTDILIGRPLLYIIASPGGSKLILSFASCHSCPNSFFKLITEIRKKEVK